MDPCDLFLICLKEINILSRKKLELYRNGIFDTRELKELQMDEENMMKVLAVILKHPTNSDMTHNR